MKIVDDEPVLRLGPMLLDEVGVIGGQIVVDVGKNLGVSAGPYQGRGDDPQSRDDREDEERGGLPCSRSYLPRERVAD